MKQSGDTMYTGTDQTCCPIIGRILRVTKMLTYIKGWTFSALFTNISEVPGN